MSTRGLYTFTDSEGDSFTVFKHWDNYPSGGLRFIQNALKLSWELPRFEADEFTGAFIAANKKAGGGDLRLTNEKTTNGDVLGIEFHYYVSAEGDRLKVKIHDLYKGEFMPDIFITADTITEAADTLAA